MLRFKFLFLHLAFLSLSIASIGQVKKLGGRVDVSLQERSIAQGVSVKVFGEMGEEWRLEGEELLLFQGELWLHRVLLRSASGYLIKADSIVFSKDKNRGKIEGNVEIRGEALLVRMGSAFIDFNKNLLFGDGKVMVWKDANFIEGDSFEVHLRPLKVIIRGVRTKHEA